MTDFSNLPRPFFVLAPMDDVTDTVFRQMVASCAAPDLYVTEFVNVDGLQSLGRKHLLKKLVFTPTEHPLIAQIWGKEPEHFYKTARELADGTFARELGLLEGVNFAGIDLNMGCPDKTVVKHGACSALMNNPELAVDIIRATQQGANGKLPVSVKTRLGFSQIDLGWHELLLQQNIAMLTVHLRTRKEMSKVPAHWEYLRQLRELRDRLAPHTLIVANGDIMSRQQGLDLAKQYGIDGIMIGRGIFHDPYVFASQSQWNSLEPADKLKLFERHIRLFADTWHGDRPLAILNKFCKLYVNGFDGAKELREQFMAARSTEELLGLLKTI